jgi:hypothetical protein
MYYLHRVNGTPEEQTEEALLHVFHFPNRWGECCHQLVVHIWQLRELLEFLDTRCAELFVSFVVGFGRVASGGGRCSSCGCLCSKVSEKVYRSND